MSERSRAIEPFAEVYERELPAVTRLAYLLVRSHGRAEELAHDAFVRLYERFDARRPAEGARTVSRTNLSDDALADLLARTFEAVAADVEVSSAPFEPERRVEADLVGTVSRSHTWRRPLAAVAAAIVVAALGVSAAVVWTDADEAGDDLASGREAADARTGGSEAAPVSAPDGVLAPSVVPDDLTLFAVDWAELPAGAGTPGMSQQLFTSDDGTGVVVQLQPGEGQSGGEPVTVRGLAGTTTPAKEFADTDTSLFWSEGGVSVTATYTGMPQPDVLAFLDSLTWRSDDHMQGFAPPSSGDLTLQVEVLAGQATGGTTPVLTGRFRYVADAPTLVTHAGRQVEVRTSTGPVSVTSSTNLQQALHCGVDRSPLGRGDAGDRRCTGR